MIRITSFNANGLRNRRQQTLMVCEADIICLQETHWDEEVMREVEREWIGEISDSPSCDRWSTVFIKV